MSNEQTPAQAEPLSPSVGDRPKPKRKLTKAEVKEQLRRRSASIDGHLAGLQQEMKASGEAAQHAVERSVQEYTMAILGGLGLAGAAIGYWVMSRRQRKRRRAAERTWAEEYREAIRDEVRAATRRGEDPGDAASRILEGHQPVVVRERAGTPTESQGVLRTVADLAGRTLVSLAVKYAVDAASSQVMSGPDAQEVGEAGDDAAPVVGAVSSQE